VFFTSITPVNTYDQSPITPAEAVASQILVNEGEALIDAFGQSYESQQTLRGLLDIGKNDYPTDIILGFCEFGQNLALAARGRTLVYTKERTINVIPARNPRAQTNFDSSNTMTLNLFSSPLHQDNMEIGPASSQAIIQFIQKIMDNIQATNPSDCMPDIRTKNILKGAHLAKDLYLEAHELAKKQGFLEYLSRAT